MGQREELKREFRLLAAPIMKFVGHVLAVSIGLVLLTLILLIPLALVRALSRVGLDQLGDTMHTVERVLLYVDLGFYFLTLLIGALELVLVEALRAARTVRVAFRALFSD